MDRTRSSSTLKNAFVAFFNLAKCGAKLRTARKITTSSLFWHRIHAMTQPVVQRAAEALDRANTAAGRTALRWLWLRTDGPPTTVCTATSQNDLLHEPAPLPFGAYPNATPLDAAAVGSSVEPATMIHQVAETSAEPDLAMPILPVEESGWQSGQTVLPSEPHALDGDAPAAETTAEPDWVAESRGTSDALPSFAEQVTLPWAQDSLDTPELQATVGQADALVRRGFELASRGAVFSARAQFEKTLRVLAEALDATMGVDHHCKSLAAGLVALKG